VGGSLVSISLQRELPPYLWANSAEMPVWETRFQFAITGQAPGGLLLHLAPAISQLNRQIRSNQIFVRWRLNGHAVVLKPEWI